MVASSKGCLECVFLPKTNHESTCIADMVLLDDGTAALNDWCFANKVLMVKHHLQAFLEEVEVE